MKNSYQRNAVISPPQRRTQGATTTDAGFRCVNITAVFHAVLNKLAYQLPEYQLLHRPAYPRIQHPFIDMAVITPDIRPVDKAGSRLY